MLQRRRAQDPQPVQDLVTAQYRVQDLLQLGSDGFQPLQYVAIWCNTLQYRIIMDTIIYNYIYIQYNYIYMHDANYMIIYDYVGGSYLSGKSSCKPCWARPSFNVAAWLDVQGSSALELAQTAQFCFDSATNVSALREGARRSKREIAEIAKIGEIAEAFQLWVNWATSIAKPIFCSVFLKSQENWEV